MDNNEYIYSLRYLLQDISDINKKYKPEPNKRRRPNKLNLKIRRVLDESLFYIIRNEEYSNYIKSLKENSPRNKKLKWLGCSRKEFILYIESLFLDGMNWNNYGAGYIVGEGGKPLLNQSGKCIKLNQWQIDHIRPISSFDLNNPDDLSKIHFFKNLHPMWAEDHMAKGGKKELNLNNDKDFYLLTKYPSLSILIKGKI